MYYRPRVDPQVWKVGAVDQSDRLSTSFTTQNAPRAPTETRGEKARFVTGGSGQQEMIFFDFVRSKVVSKVLGTC